MGQTFKSQNDQYHAISMLNTIHHNINPKKPNYFPLVVFFYTNKNHINYEHFIVYLLSQSFYQIKEYSPLPRIQLLRLLVTHGVEHFKKCFFVFVNASMGFPLSTCLFSTSKNMNKLVISTCEAKLHYLQPHKAGCRHALKSAGAWKDDFESLTKLTSE